MGPPSQHQRPLLIENVRSTLVQCLFFCRGHLRRSGQSDYTLNPSACPHTHVYTHTHTYTHNHTHPTSPLIYIYTHTHTHTHTHTQAHTLTHSLTHTHTHLTVFLLCSSYNKVLVTPRPWVTFPDVQGSAQERKRG